MASGGARQGTPGTAYPNRTDMAANRQPITAPTGLGYGERKKLEDAQAAVPIASPGLAAPTARPNEPITHGLPMGPGGGPEVLGMSGNSDDDIALQLRAIYKNFPDDNIRALIEMYDQGF